MDKLADFTLGPLVWLRRTCHLNCWAFGVAHSSWLDPAGFRNWVTSFCVGPWRFQFVDVSKRWPPRREDAHAKGA